MRPTFITYALTAGVANTIALSQTPGGAGNLTINGGSATGGVATLSTQRQVGITSAANDSGRTFTITGTDINGAVISEAVAGANVGVAVSVNNYKTVTQIAVDAATAGAVTAGTTAVGASPWLELDYITTPFNVGLFVEVSGTVNYTIQHCGDDLQRTPTPVAYNHAFLNGLTVNSDGNYVIPVKATRIKINSGTGTVTLRILQGINK